MCSTASLSLRRGSVAMSVITLAGLLEGVEKITQTRVQTSMPKSSIVSVALNQALARGTTVKPRSRTVA